MSDGGGGGLAWPLQPVDPGLLTDAEFLWRVRALRQLTQAGVVALNSLTGVTGGKGEFFQCWCCRRISRKERSDAEAEAEFAAMFPDYADDEQMTLCGACHTTAMRLLHEYGIL